MLVVGVNLNKRFTLRVVPNSAQSRGLWKGAVMRYLLALWFVPLALFWGWYGLAANDLNFGTLFFSRDVHDAVFAIYGNAIGVPGSDVPAIIAGACAFDTAIVGAIVAFKWRSDWFPQLKATAIAYWHDDESELLGIKPKTNDQVHPAE